MNIDDFHFLLGQTIMYCQIIENDIKLIYAGMLHGNFDENLFEIEKWTLGKTLNELKTLDFSDNHRYISAEHYNYLTQMTEKRNHWCHNCYIEFLYNNDYVKSPKYLKECQKLKKDNSRLELVYQAVEKLRLNAMKDFDRI